MVIFVTHVKNSIFMLFIFYFKSFSKQIWAPYTSMLLTLQEQAKNLNRFVSRSAHQTPNFTNSEFQFPQFKVLQSGFFYLII